jgi:hypothetical protein
MKKTPIGTKHRMKKLRLEKMSNGKNVEKHLEKSAHVHSMSMSLSVSVSMDTERDMDVDMGRFLQ